jgi:predicted transcriptional regulator
MGGKKHLFTELSRRERQIMEIIYQHGTATAARIQKEMPDPPSYATVRTILRVLEEKGHARHDQVGRKFVYRPTASAKSLRRSALQRLVTTLFDGSVESVVATLLDSPSLAVSGAELERIAKMIKEAKEKGGK